MSLADGLTLAVLLVVLALAAYVDRVYSEMGKFLAREYQDNIDAWTRAVEPRLRLGRESIALSASVLRQLALAAIALIAGLRLYVHVKAMPALLARAPSLEEIAFTAFLLVLLILFFDRLLPQLLFTRTRGLWIAHIRLLLEALFYLILPVTLTLGLLLSIVALGEPEDAEEEEHPSEAMDALLEAGEEEGILEESDRDLIQSVVEFGDKTVREVMTPRPDIVAVAIGTTIEKFTELIKKYPYSRIPVYEGDIDHIKGIVYAKDLLQVLDTDARTKTVRDLMKPDVYFVPETKLGSELLREMQRDNIRMAIVIDEYGGVGGLVTIEDLVEEIVGEIRDEHEKADVVKESESSYVLNGNTDVDLLEKLLGVRPDEKEATTIAGLVSELAGHIPKAGEVFEENGLRFEVLESTDRRVDRVRVSLQTSPASKQVRS